MSSSNQSSGWRVMMSSSSRPLSSSCEQLTNSPSTLPLHSSSPAGIQQNCRAFLLLQWAGGGNPIHAPISLRPQAYSPHVGRGACVYEGKIRGCLRLVTHDWMASPFLFLLSETIRTLWATFSSSELLHLSLFVPEVVAQATQFKTYSKSLEMNIWISPCFWENCHTLSVLFSVSLVLCLLSK